MGCATRCTLSVLVVWAGAAAASAADPPRYRFEAEKQYAYEVEIKAELPDRTETLKGTISYEVKSAGDPLKLTYHGGLKKTTAYKASRSVRSSFDPPGFGLFSGGPFGSIDALRGLSQTTNQVTLNAQGHTLAIEGSSQLPYLAGNLSLLVFEPLPEADEQSWTVDSGVTITQRGKAWDIRRPHFYRTLGSATIGSTAESRSAGSQSVSFTLQAGRGKQATYEKTLRLRSPGGDRDVTIEGKGTWVFSRKLGISESLDFSQELQVSQGNLSVTVPVTIKYRRFSDAEWAKITKQREEEARKAREAAEKAAAEKKAEAEAPIKGDQRAEVLAALEAESLSELTATLKMLAAKTDRADEEVAAAVEPLLEHADQGVRKLAQSALARFSPEFKRKFDLNRAYNGFFPVSELGTPVADETPLPPGLIVAATRHSRWYAGKVCGELPDGKIEIQFQKTPWKEGRGRADIRLAPPEVDQPHVDPALLDPALRTWTDDSGTFEVKAEFLGLKGDNVRLRLVDGREVEVPLDRLSKKDRDFIGQQHEKPKPTNPFEP